ncbi:hypothetical protein CU002_2705 [Enterococcus faecium]|nr:hypothetical protein [Enterococcus faecium]
MIFGGVPLGQLSKHKEKGKQEKQRLSGIAGLKNNLTGFINESIPLLQPITSINIKKI